MLNSQKTETILHQVNQPIALASGLPNECYTDEAAFIADRDHVIGPGWACIGFVDQLPEQNYCTPVEFMQLPLLLTRDENDIIRVFHNVCSHRGMELSDRPCKNNGSIRCPYHAWSYGLDGTLRSTPNIGGYGVHTHADFDNSANGLRELRSAVWLGAVYVNLSGNAAPFDTYTAPIRDNWAQLLPAADLQRYTFCPEHSRMSLTVQSNWKLAVENYLEAYHLPTVHPELNRISPLPQHYSVEPFENGTGQGSLNYTRLKIDQIQLPELGHWRADKNTVAEYPALFPNTFLGIHADHLFIMYLQPLSNTETLEHVRVFFVGDEALDARYQKLRETVLRNWEKVFREDIFAVERMQKGRMSPAFTGGAFSPAMDEPTLHFHRWVAAALNRSTS